MQQQLTQNTLLQGGKYKIEKELGHGGFGITYLGLQTGLERNVAIKEFFMKQYCDRDDFSRVSYSTEANKEVVTKCKDKFLKEARMIASLEHPNIVKVYDIFEENNTAYYVMEYVDGCSLDKLMEKGSIPELTAINYISQVGKALEYIHDRNILHLDVKPANILLRKNGSIVLIDFGISKHYDSDGNQTSTMQGALSKGYSPLEQGNGLLQDFTTATDVYSLGATLMALITGHAPLDASKIMNFGLPNCPSNVSSMTWSAIDKAMRPRRRDRVQTVKEFIELLPKESRLFSKDSHVSNPISNDLRLRKIANEETIIRNPEPGTSKDEETIIDKPSNHHIQHPNTSANSTNEEQFCLTLKLIGEAKLSVIKVISETCGISLSDAKNIINSVPAIVKSGLSKAESENLKKRIESTGAVVEISRINDVVKEKALTKKHVANNHIEEYKDSPKSSHDGRNIGQLLCFCFIAFIAFIIMFSLPGKTFMSSFIDRVILSTILTVFVAIYGYIKKW